MSDESSPIPQSNSTLRRTPLHSKHVELGATMCPFGGWSMPLRYRSELAEHVHVRERAGLFDLSHMAELFVTGVDAGVNLDRTLVSVVSGIPVGRAKYTLVCNEEGGVLDDVVVYRLDAERFMVVANAVNREVVRCALEENGCIVDDATERTALIAIQGPTAPATLDALGMTEHHDLGYYRIVDATIGGLPVLLARTGYTGELGYELYVSSAGAPALWSILSYVEGISPVGLAARDSLRLEAGMHLYGNELGPEINPFEAGLGRLVHLDRGDFRGRSALSDLAKTEPSRRIVGLRSKSRRIPRAGSTLTFGNGSVGRVTSGAFGPTVGGPIAMALVENAMSALGTELQAESGRTAIDCEIADLPFYSRTRGQST